MLIVLSGLPATGKTTLAAAIARELGAVLLSVDPVDSALASIGVRDPSAVGIAAYAVVGALAEQNLAIGATVVADAVNAVGEAKTFWIDLSRRRGVPLLAIETILSDGDLHRQRLAERVRNLAIAEPTWEAVVNRRDEWMAWPFAPLVVDSVEPLALNVARVLEAVRMVEAGRDAPGHPDGSWATEAAAGSGPSDPGHNETPEGTSGP